MGKFNLAVQKIATKTEYDQHLLRPRRNSVTVLRASNLPMSTPGNSPSARQMAIKEAGKLRTVHG